MLPLRDSVAFPETLMPLAVGQERSVRLVNDVLARQPDARDGGRATRRRRGARPRRALRVGVAGVVARMLKVPGRHAADPRPRRAAGRARRTSWPPSRTWSRASPRRPTSSCPSPRARGAAPQRSGDLLAHHRGGPVPARGAADGGGQPRRPRRARAHDRRRAADQDRGEAGAAGGARRDEAAAEALRAARPRAGAGRDRHEDPVAGPVRDGQGSARVLPAPAAQGDPGGAGRGRRDPGRGDRAARAARAGASCPSTPGSRPSESCSASSGCRRRRPSTA